MSSIIDKITEFFKDFLMGWVLSNFDTMFTDVNNKVSTIATEVGKTPQDWNSGIFTMIRTLSENVIVPIAGMIITFVLCYELISMIMEKNNMHDIDTFMFFKYIFKMWVAVYFVTHTFDITMAVFDVAQHVVRGAGNIISGSTNIDVQSALVTIFQNSYDTMSIGELLGLGLETMIVSLCMKIMSVLITVILYGRMIEIYLYVSVSPIPFATMTNREYVKVLDSKGHSYSANKYMECFDTDKPTINGAINDGLLSVQAYDSTSRITVIYVNGYEFTDLTNGTLNIRLQQFDSGYEYFTMQAMDEAGNVSDVYKMKNPYYIDPEKEKKDNNTEPTVKPLPISAKPTEPTDAKATVTEHTSEAEDKEEVRKSDSEADITETKEGGKEFYTIQTKSEKVFYLVIDKEQTENHVYLLTEVSENDLLNFTESENEVLPQNSTVVESSLPKEKNNEMEKEKESEIVSFEIDAEGKEEALPDNTDLTQNSGNAGAYLIMVVALVGVGGGYYYLKFIKRKNVSFDDEEDEFEEEDTTEYEQDDAEEKEPASDSEDDE